jgi:RHS repeat-associated protein
VDARNVTTSYGYDAFNRNVWTAYNDGITPTLERHYDGFQGGSFVVPNGKGRFFYHVNFTQNPATGGVGYSRLVVNSYDAIGRTTAQTQGFLANDGVTWKDYQVSRTYDLASHTLTQTYPSGRSVSYSYAASGRLSSASGNLGGTSYTYADTIEYNAAGQMLKERLGTTTSLYHRHAYNKRFQMIETRLGTSSTDSQSWDRGALIFYYSNKARTAYQPFSSQDDNNGNVSMAEHYVPVTVSGGTVTSYAVAQRDRYEYDALNRIQSVASEQMTTGYSWSQVASQTFAYDRWGNRTSVTGQTAQSWSTTEAAATNRLKLTSGNQCTGVKNGLCYDAAGNVVFDNQLGASGDRTYDAENRMLTATASNKYVYDADGKRVRRQVGSSQYWQVYGIGGELVAEYQWNGTTATLQKEYGSGGAASVVAEGATVRWLVSDHLGTPRIVADQTGSLSGITRHDYLPFGEENFTGSVRVAGNGYQAEGIRQKFTGYERDAETSLDYAQARYYSNFQGRFASVDPLHASGSGAEPQSWNRYAYVGNRPTGVIDPSGLLWYRAKGSGSLSQPVWHDGNPGEGWELIAPSDLIYWGGAEHGWVRLDPNRNRFSEGFATSYDAFRGNAVDAFYDMADDFVSDLYRLPSDVAHQARRYWNNPDQFLREGELTFAALGGIVPMGGVSRVAAAESGTTSLFRAVMQKELDDLAEGVFRNPTGIEVKYFAETAEEAASYARQASRAFGDGPFTIIETRINTKLITPLMRVTVDRGISTVTVPTELLPQLIRPKIWTHSPLPK